MPIDLLWLATVLSGLLAGADVDRYLVQVPAWRGLPTRAWVDYTRRADLGPGRAFYPALAFGAALSTLGVAAAAHFGTRLPVSAARSVALAAASAIGGLLATAVAAPTLLKLLRVEGEAEGAAIFGRFHAWGLLRAALQLLSFFANVWALRECGRF
jgi:hypothetical protein